MNSYGFKTKTEPGIGEEHMAHVNSDSRGDLIDFDSTLLTAQRTLSNGVYDTGKNGKDGELNVMESFSPFRILKYFRRHWRAELMISSEVQSKAQDYRNLSALGYVVLWVRTTTH
jgi:hypothetical protein